MTWSVEDRLDLYDLFARYCRYIDSGRAAEWVALFTDDGCFDIVGQMTLRGAEQLAGMPAMLAENSGGKWRHQILTSSLTLATPRMSRTLRLRVW